MPAYSRPTAALERFSATFRERELEHAFRKYSLKRSGPTDQFVIISGAGIHLSYAALDWMVIPELAPFTTLLRVIGSLAIVALWLWTFTTAGREKIMWISVVIVMIIAGSVGLMIKLIGEITPPYYIGLLHLAVVFSAIVRINFRVCCLLLAMTYGMFVLPMPSLELNDDLISAHFFLVATLFSCATVNYVVERDRRLEYLEVRAKDAYYRQVVTMAEDAEASVKRKNALLNVLGHVVKTPLHQVIGYAQIMEQTIKQGEADGIPDSHSMAQFAGEIRKAGTSLSNQSQRILNYTRAEGGLLPSHPQRTTPKRLIKEAISRYEEKIARQCLEVIDESRDIDIIADTRHLVNGIDELIDNTLRYSPPGSTLRIWVEETVSGIVLSIEDNGPGITEGELQLQSDSLETQEDFRHMRGDKLGIGLPLSHALIKVGGGKLYFSSIPDSGSLARIVFPYPSAIADDTSAPTVKLAS